ncbi:MAG: hypothetical protein ACXV5R_10810 [Candidatus Angelobacter sp.]
MLNKGRLLLAGALIAAISFAGCSTQTKIADITKDPGRYAGKDVSIEGDVSESFSALGNGFFQIDDGGGRMWVYSQNFGVPGNGSKVVITGRVEQGFAAGGRSFGVILRQTQDRH